MLAGICKVVWMLTGLQFYQLQKKVHSTSCLLWSDLNLSLTDLVFQNIYAKLMCLKFCQIPTHVFIQWPLWEQHKLGSAQLFSWPLRYTHVEHTTNSKELHKNNKPKQTNRALYELLCHESNFGMPSQIFKQLNSLSLLVARRAAAHYPLVYYY